MRGGECLVAADKNAMGLLVVGHGTLDDRGREDYWRTVRQVARELPGTVVEGCFLEAATPDIATALEALAKQKLQEVVLVPLLLLAAGHAKRDIPAAAAQAAARTGIRVRQSAVLGCHPRILALSAERFHSAVGPGYVPAETLWLLVGRGSRDADATAELGHFATSRLALTPVNSSVVAFLAMAHPRIEEVLPQVAAMPYSTVVVQPHLLFPGALLARLQRLVDEQDRSGRRQQWILADCLRGDQAIVQVVVERFRETAGAWPASQP
jgi:sirohydrochlorin cobaltochelatase